MESGTDLQVSWHKLLFSAGVGAIFAGIGYFLFRRYNRRCGRGSSSRLKMSIEKIQEAMMEAKLDIKEAISDKLSDITDNITDQVDELVQNLKDSLMTKEMQEAVTCIETVLDKLKKADMAAKEYDSFMFVLFTLVKKAQTLEVESDVKIKTKPTDLTESQLADVGRFGDFAVKMYPVSWSFTESSIPNAMGVSKEDILLVHFTDDSDGHCPKFLLFLDHESRSLVLAIRGTFSLKDVVLDAVAEEAPFLDGFAHKGILGGARNLLARVTGQLKLVLSQYSNYCLVVTGHSLGAGTAELITMELLTSNILPVDCKVKCVALAPPPVYRAERIPDKISSAIRIYVNNYDCVPRLSMATVSRLLAMVREVDGLGLSLSEQLSILVDRDTPDVKQNILRLRNIIKVQQKSFPDLEHPGTIYHIMRSPTDDQKQLVYHSKSSAFTSTLLLWENMIVDHLHSSYGDTILNLITGNKKA